MTKAERVKYLIIGNSAGGIGAAEAIREVDRAGAIAIVSSEPYHAYSRPLISQYLVEGRPLQRMMFRPADFYKEKNIQAILGQEVTGLNIDKHNVKLDDGRSIIWEKLLLATGSSPIVPNIEGIGLKGVFTFTTRDDARAIYKFLNQYHTEVRAVVIGGGLIGISATEALVKRGVKVTIVEMKERILNTILDEEASFLVEASLNELGVEIINGHIVSRITSFLPGRATGIALDNDRPIPCEMVIVAVGVQPRTKIVSETGIRIDRGILVDHHMATSSPDVYACGDVAEAYDFIYDENRLTPIWPNAYIGGRIAGFNMAGLPTEYQGGTSMNAMKYFGLAIVSAGILTPPDDSYEVISEKHGHVYKKVVLKNGLIVGVIFSGDIEKSGIIYNLMKNRVNVDTFKQALIADDFGLISLPEEIWRPLLEHTSPVTPSLATSDKQPEKMAIGDLGLVSGR
ncbi:MAG TPA: NAD(P)/FAD-dependent oxidoreductase [Dehalococcoidia bacterium]|nr:NAD(P)/FAD-dependent oxidoreductase [Dehalococcoidia bacterium]